jgi:hypothetical protein
MKRYHLGRKISFVCVARGNPRPQITWLKDGLELTHDQIGVSRENNFLIILQTLSERLQILD